MRDKIESSRAESPACPPPTRNASRTGRAIDGRVCGVQHALRVSKAAFRYVVSDTTRFGDATLDDFEDVDARGRKQPVEDFRDGSPAQA